MKNIATLLTFVTVVLLCSCTNKPYTLLDRTQAYQSSNNMAKPAPDFRLVANKPVVKSASADANWIAAANPHVVAAMPKRSRRVNRVALSAATTIEGHQVLRKEIGKAMKSSQASTKKLERKQTRKTKAAAGPLMGSTL